MSACATCGTPLTMSTRAIGTNQCATCATTSSPGGELGRIYARFAADPTLTEAKLVGRPLASSALQLLVGAIVTCFLYVVFTAIAGAMAGVGSSAARFMPLAGLFGLGLARAGAAAIQSRLGQPLDVARWPAFANGLTVGVVVGAIASVFVEDAWLFALPGALVLGLLAVVVTEGSRKERLRGQFSAYRAMQEAARLQAHAAALRVSPVTR